MSRQSLLDYLTRKSDSYEQSGELGMTGAKGGDFQVVFSPVCERPLFHSGYDVFGVHWSAANPSSHYTQGQAPILHSIENWRDEVRFPRLDHFDWGYVEQQAKAVDRDAKVVITTLAVGPFERTTSLSSFEDCLVNAIADPEDYADLIGAIADYKIGIIDRICRYANPDIVNLHDDWGTSISTFFRPDHWREVIKPHTQRMYDAVHGHGALVSQHSDGAIGALIPDMVEMGADIWEGGREIPDQIEDLRSQYGDRLCIVIPPELPRSKGDPVVPDIDDVPKNYRPYEAVPEFLYREA